LSLVEDERLGLEVRRLAVKAARAVGRLLGPVQDRVVREMGRGVEK